MLVIRKKLQGEWVVPLLLIAPSLIFVILIFIIPLVQAGLLAFQNDDGQFVFDNITRAYNDFRFWPAIRNTAILVGITVPIQIALALSLTMVLTKIKRFRTITLYFWTVPLAISDLAAGIIWLLVFTQSGYLNEVLLGLGIIDQPVIWLSFNNTTAVIAAIVIAEVWRATAIVLIILVAGVQLIPKEYDEAAEIFGANAFTRFWRITLPLLKPSLQTALILRTILAFEAFAVVSALVGTVNFPVLAGEAFRWNVDVRNEGVASFYALVILGVSILTTLFFLLVLRTKHEETA